MLKVGTTICIGQSHLFRCATIRFEHHRGGDQNTEALGYLELAQQPTLRSLGESAVPYAFEDAA